MHRESFGFPHPGGCIAAVVAARKPRPDAWLIAKRSRLLPDRAGRCCGAPEKSSAETGLLRGRSLVGWPAKFFFLGCLLGLFHGPQTADLSIDIDQLASQGLELAELRNLTFRLTDSRRRGEVLRNGLAIHFLSELKMRAVTGVVGFGAMATGTSAASGKTTDGTRLEVAELGDALEQIGRASCRERRENPEI